MILVGSCTVSPPPAPQSTDTSETAAPPPPKAMQIIMAIDTIGPGFNSHLLSDQSPVNAATHEMLKDKLDKVLDTLTFREREIIKLRYGIGDGYTYTLEEVGRIFKVTRERVRQIEAKAVRKLQHPVRSRMLEGFLEGSRG